MAVDHLLWVKFTFTDVMYADDTTLFLPSPDDASTSLTSFSQTAASLGLRMSWPTTKLQNLCYGSQPPTTHIDGNLIGSVDKFVYLGNLQSSYGYCRPDWFPLFGPCCTIISSLYVYKHRKYI